MADQTGTHHTSTNTSSGGSTGLAFIVGALVVAVGVMGYVLFVDSGSSDDLTITVDGAGGAVEGAAAAVEGAANAVEDATN